MSDAEAFLEHLIVARDIGQNSDEFGTFTDRLLPAVADAERLIDVDDMNIGLLFEQSPTASALARGLDEMDRQARRVVAASRLGVRPETLRGRGVRLVPRSQGLIVERADAGSLDVLVALGGLYQAVVSQPVSFVLNMAALMEYSKAMIRLPRPRDSKADGIVVRLPQLLAPQDHEVYTADGADEQLEAAVQGEIQIPSDYSRVTMRIKTSGDKSSIKIDCEK